MLKLIANRCGWELVTPKEFNWKSLPIPNTNLGWIPMRGGSGWALNFKISNQAVISYDQLSK